MEEITLTVPEAEVLLMSLDGYANNQLNYELLKKTKKKLEDFLCPNDVIEVRAEMTGVYEHR